MPAIQRPSSARPRPINGSAGLHVVVFPKVKSTDPSLKATVRDGLVILSGVASKRGTKPGSVSFEFAGQTISVQLRGGMTGSGVHKALSEALPEGFQLHTPAWVGRNGAGTMSFQIRTTPRAESNVKAIDAAFDRAAKTPGRVTVAELREAVAIAERGGVSKDDREALARNWAALFTTGGATPTAAAQREYARVQQRYGLPVVGVI